MKTRNIILYFIGLLAFCSCQDMFEPADENNRQLEDLAEESKYAHGLLMYAYDRLPYITTTQTDVATDDAVTNDKGSGYLSMATGSWRADSNPMSQWDGCKDGIQYVNLFLSIVDKVKWAPSAKSKQQMFIDRMTGEALGLRALFYYYLLMAHGGYAEDGILYGVPLLTEAEDGSSDYNQPRATFGDCVKQIFSDCDRAMELLPYTYQDLNNPMLIPQKYQDIGAQLTGYNLVFGSASFNLMSAKVVEAIKAQTAVLAASPAFRDGQDVVNSAKAAELCANVLSHIGGINGLDKDGYYWYSSKNKNKLEPAGGELAEMVWQEDRHKNIDQESTNFPPTLYGSGRVNPSQNLVDAFPMRSGLPITDANSGYNDQDPYANRDPRLSEYILYNGTTYRRTEIITGNYPNSKSESEDNLNKISTSTRTGYYLKKLLRDDVSAQTSSQIAQYHVYPRIRYTEIFLAYAEAANDAWGPTKDGAGVGYSAYDVIKAIRTRAGLATNEVGMPLDEGDVYLEECAKDQAKMTNLIRNERRLELCFENKRFWDMRRWMLPLNETVRGVMIDRDEETSKLTYKYFDVEERNYNNAYQCYGPIPNSEILRWSNLKQNKGW